MQGTRSSWAVCNWGEGEVRWERGKPGSAAKEVRGKNVRVHKIVELSRENPPRKRELNPWLEDLWGEVGRE